MVQHCTNFVVIFTAILSPCKKMVYTTFTVTGKCRKSPTPAQLREVIGKFTRSLVQHGNGRSARIAAARPSWLSQNRRFSVENNVTRVPLRGPSCSSCVSRRRRIARDLDRARASGGTKTARLVRQRQNFSFRRQISG